MKKVCLQWHRLIRVNSGLRRQIFVSKQHFKASACELNKANFRHLVWKTGSCIFHIIVTTSLREYKLCHFVLVRHFKKASCEDLLQLTEVRVLSELPAKPRHGLSQDGLRLCVARSLLLSPHAWHGVHHAHLSSGGCGGKAVTKSES